MNATTRGEQVVGESAERGSADRPADSSDGRVPAVVHLDLDGARHIFRLRGWPWRAETDPVFETGVPRALDMFDAFAIRATFFLIAEDLDDPTKAALVREIARRGHEIGSHSLTHSPLRGLSADQLEREVAGSRDRIHQELGTMPAGFRAPFFSIDAPAVRAVARAGYTYDTSMMPGRAVPGVRRVPDRPGPVHENLIEVPLPAFRPLPYPFHPSYSLVLGVRYFDWGLARFANTRAPLVLLFHLIDFAEPLPSSMVGGWKQRLFTLSHIGGQRKLDACRRMLDRVRRSFSITQTTRVVDSARSQHRETSS
jgi:hypothetical protein